MSPSISALCGPEVGYSRLTTSACASIGARPTFGENRPNLEVHLIDFSGDLYGAEVSVALVSWQRPELRFESAEALVRQMELDVREARVLLEPVLEGRAR